jgi:hypothetical protein
MVGTKGQMVQGADEWGRRSSRAAKMAARLSHTRWLVHEMEEKSYDPDTLTVVSSSGRI